MNQNEGAHPSATIVCRSIPHNGKCGCEFMAAIEFPNPVILRVMDKVNVREKLALISDYWNPRIVGELNGQHVKLVKFKGDFVWHNHADEDEFFLVLRGSFRMEFHDRTVSLNEGDFVIVPRGVEHRPVAENEVDVMLFEPSNIKHTGDIETEMTVHNYERI